MIQLIAIKEEVFLGGKFSNDTGYLIWRSSLFLFKILSTLRQHVQNL
jgi:hypothetical protein